jgi:hypothetical protein
LVVVVAFDSILSHSHIIISLISYPPPPFLVVSLEFCHQLQRLVEQAPPLGAISDDHHPSSPPSAAAAASAQITQLQSTPRFQSILVTHFHHLEEPSTSPSSSAAAATTTNHEEEEDNFPEGSMRHYYDDDQQEQEQQEEQDHAAADDEADEESFDPPWPSAHESFCALPDIQDHVVLEIAAGRDSQGRRPTAGGGGGANNANNHHHHGGGAMECTKGHIKVVVPGSLRTRGEYCVVDVAFGKAATTTTGGGGGGAGGGGGEYKWRVSRTRFRTLSEHV